MNQFIIQFGSGDSDSDNENDVSSSVECGDCVDDVDCSTESDHGSISDEDDASYCADYVRHSLKSILGVG